MTMVVKNGMTLFFSKDCPLSNWNYAPFEWFGLSFVNTEQFMMYCKAMVFDDEETAQKIMAATEPADHKALGRQVRNFDQAIWDEKCEYFVEMGALAKFRQNPEKAKVLIDTLGTELVEASPYDKIWGVGLSADNPRILDKTKWPGENRLGKVLERVRDTLVQELLL